MFYEKDGLDYLDFVALVTWYTDDFAATDPLEVVGAQRHWREEEGEQGINLLL